MAPRTYGYYGISSKSGLIQKRCRVNLITRQRLKAKEKPMSIEVTSATDHSIYILVGGNGSDFQTVSVVLSNFSGPY